MAPRLQLQALLEDILDTGKVYFQPPANVQMQYPCIVYQRDNMDTTFANNVPYGVEKRYQVTVIDRNADSDIPDRVALLPKTVMVRHFTADNLHHDVFTVYF